MLQATDKVAVIGGGIAGMAIALSLHAVSVPCTVYEMRSLDQIQASRTAGGAMMLSPNGLRILDRLGLYSRILPASYQFEWVYYKNGDEKTTDRFPQGHEAAYGYKAVRIYRQELLDVLRTACAERGIQVVFGKRFASVTAETAAGVEFQFADGDTGSAALLVGAEGIHSRIRGYVSPGAPDPKFLGLTSLSWETPRSQLRIPKEKDYKFPVGVMMGGGPAGAFIMAPQRPDGSAMLTGMQFPIEDLGREDWAAMLADTEGLVARAQAHTSRAPDIVRSAAEHIDPSTFNMWPFRALAPLPRWASAPHRRVVILGDAAHAVPPTTGQGASQAFEDTWSLALLVGKLRDAAGEGGQGSNEDEPEKKMQLWGDALDFWQGFRQRRMADLMDLTRRLNNKRLPLEKQAELGPDDLWFDESESNPKQMAWLYCPPIQEEIDRWAQERLG